MKITTERLIITRFSPDMAADVSRNSLDDDMRRFLPDEVFVTEQDAAGAIEYLSSRYDGQDGPFVYPIILRSGENVGYVEAARLGGGDWEIGYHVAKRFTGNGYATEAVKAFLPFIMKKLNLARIYGITVKENAASERVLKGCGFTPEYEGEGVYQGEKRRIARYVFCAAPDTKKADEGDKRNA